MNIYAKDVELKIISSCNQDKIYKQFEEWKSSVRYSDAVILDLRVTEIDDNYTLWIFYRE